MALRCKRCGSEERVKNGFMKGLQRYRCKACGLNFTDTPPRGMPLRTKLTAVLLYVSGLSMNRTAKLLGVSTPSVMTWIEQFAKAYGQKPEPEGRAAVVELDEMWRFLKQRPASSGSGRLGIGLRDGSSTGSWAVVTELATPPAAAAAAPMVKRGPGRPRKTPLPVVPPTLKARGGKRKTAATAEPGR